MEKNKKQKAKKEEAKTGKNTIAGKHCYNQQCYVWGATMLFPHHLQSNIVYKIKIGSGINRGVLKLAQTLRLYIYISGKRKKI